MKTDVLEINVINVAFSTALSFGVLWVICSGLVMLMPDAMMLLTGHMLHVNLPSAAWSLTLPGFFLGLFGWMITAGVLAGMIAKVNNWLSR
ncbi:MAG: hypothetical protein JKY88_00170 [Pseudomonadales bacterium]|nr:hypothetical protein [Pseudomonadales bacterium]